MMRNISFICKEYGWTYQEVMDMPYIVFLSFLKWTRIFQVEQTEKGRELLYKEDTTYKQNQILAK